MLGYRELKDAGKSYNEIRTTLGYAEKKDFRLRKAAGYADKYSSARLAELLLRIYRVNRDVKTGLYSDKLALTMFVAEM
jgi:DNA polymerase III delta subunit